PAATISDIEVRHVHPGGLKEFTIRESLQRGQPRAGISADLAVCDDCLAELFDPVARRYRYPYINCTNCGPRYSVILSLPYDRDRTTIRHWNMDAYCREQYHDPADRRFHAQPVACHDCGPRYWLRHRDVEQDGDPVTNAASLLKAGAILAIKGLGGYHLACDA